MTVAIEHPSIRPASNRFGPFKSPDHSCSLCGRLCPGRRSRCFTCNQRLRRLIVKSAAVQLLGGVATCCGWSGHLAGYVFHHRDGKEFQIGMTKGRKWTELKAEILKCELWCARCHCIHHSSYDDANLIAAARQYRGPLQLHLPETSTPTPSISIRTAVQS